MTGEVRKNPAKGKLALKWEGSFRVKENLGNKAYKLKLLTGESIPRTWNSTHLKFYYS